MDLEETLEHIGLSGNDAKVYLALLREGSSKAGTVAKSSELNRASTYNSLDSLVKKGLASYVIIRGVKWFQASDPRNLRKFLENKMDFIDAALPELEEIHSSEKLPERVSLYKGKRGVKTVLEDILANADENCLFGSEGQLKERMPIYAEKFLRRLRRNGIKVRSLVRKGREKEQAYPSTEVRFVPKSVESPVITNIYDNKIALLIWSDPPEAVIIENEMAAKAYKSYFEFMWEHAKKP